MKVTTIPIVICALGTIPKGLVMELEDLEIRGRLETIQTTALLKSARILRSVLETWGDLLSLRCLWNNTCLHWCEKLKIRVKLWNMKVIIIPIVIGAFGTVTKGLLKGLDDLEVGRRVETIQTTALLRTARILRRVLVTWGDYTLSRC